MDFKNRTFKVLKGTFQGVPIFYLGERVNSKVELLGLPRFPEVIVRIAFVIDENSYYLLVKDQCIQLTHKEYGDLATYEVDFVDAIRTA